MAKALTSEERADQILRLVNSTSFTPREVAEHCASGHRFLQQELFKFCMAYVEEMHEKHMHGYYDARNAWSCKLSNEIVEKVLLSSENYFYQQK